jgi:hypothetical protein
MRLLTFVLMLGLGFIVGCSQNSSPPPPLTAFNDLQMLINRADLTKDQMSVATRGVATVQTLLQSAQTQGDAKAAETLKTYQSTK